ncbi:MAG: hypothetical protein HY718_11410 [Planctomycetes bacterium]|nr:hypothetical protein [Planctomycetota bacterium]
MGRAWAAIGILATSWLAGLSYYHQADWTAWGLLVAAGTALVVGTVRRLPTRWECAIAAIVMCPVVLLAPWPWRLSFVLLFVGAIVAALPIPRRWPRAAAAALLVGGMILVAQSLAMLIYEARTARSHELPRPLAELVYAVARLVGIDAGLAGGDVVLPSMRQPHPIGATWGLLIDPATFCFFAGGVAMLALRARTELPRGRRLGWLIRAVVRLVLCVAAWLPIRVGLMLSLYLHRVLRTDFDAPLAVVAQLWNTWLHFGLLVGPVLLAWRFVPGPPSADEHTAAISDTAGALRRVLAGGLAFLAVAALTAAALYEPVGSRKGYRVAVDEFHSTWEPTTRPFDTEWYGNESGYNYACIYDYCSRFYDMSRLAQAIDDRALGDVDVLILKVPNRSRYGPEEIAALERFVNGGGGLLLIGEHTDVFKTGTHLNDVARRFGFEFRYDCLFGIDSVFEQLYTKPWVPHPIVQHLPPLDFAVSCSIDPGSSPGRAAIVGTGLKNLTADYHASNFYPQAEDRPEMRYGAFVQLWTTRRGAGRVAAFTDSTQFSNFCVFDPGKSELMLGMIEWLNHRNGTTEPRSGLMVVGLVLLLAAAVAGRRWDGAWLVLLAAGALGWLATGLVIRDHQARAYPVAQPVRPMVRVMFDRTVCDAGLATNGFTAGKPDEFGIFERWVLRLGWFTHRASGDAAFKGDMLVFLAPDSDAADQPVIRAVRDKLVKYVEDGGKVLVVDMPANAKSIANSLLYPFDLSVDHARRVDGQLTGTGGWDPVAIESACAVKGGRPWAHVDGVPVGTTARYGAGSITVIGFGSRLTDNNMGVTGDVLPDSGLQRVYDLEFAIFRGIMNGALASQPATTTSPE